MCRPFSISNKYILSLHKNIIYQETLIWKMCIQNKKITLRDKIF